MVFLLPTTKPRNSLLRNKLLKVEGIRHAYEQRAYIYIYIYIIEFMKFEYQQDEEPFTEP